MIGIDFDHLSDNDQCDVTMRMAEAIVNCIGEFRDHRTPDGMYPVNIVMHALAMVMASGLIEQNMEDKQAHISCMVAFLREISGVTTQ